MSEVAVVGTTTGPPERRWIGAEKAVWLLCLLMTVTTVAVVVSPWSPRFTISERPPLAW